MKNIIPSYLSVFTQYWLLVLSLHTNFNIRHTVIETTRIQNHSRVERGRCLWRSSSLISLLKVESARTDLAQVGFEYLQRSKHLNLSG